MIPSLFPSHPNLIFPFPLDKLRLAHLGMCTEWYGVCISCSYTRNFGQRWKLFAIFVDNDIDLKGVSHYYNQNLFAPGGEQKYLTESHIVYIYAPVNGMRGMREP
jgi:hypothetical protein